MLAGLSQRPNVKSYVFKFITNFREVQSEKFLLLGSGWRYLLIWPILAIIAIGASWGLAQSRIEADRAALARSAVRELHALSGIYAQQISHSLSLIDEFTLKAQRAGFSDTSHFDVNASIELMSTYGYAEAFTTDNTGRPISQNRELSPTVSRGAFSKHLSSPSMSLQIQGPPKNSGSFVPVTQLSRRISGPQGEFKGVVVVGLSREFFNFPGNADALGPDGLLVVAAPESLARFGTPDSSSRATAINPALYAGLLRSAAKEAVPVKGSEFHDGKDRFVSITPLDGYPFYAVAGIPVEQAMAAAEETAHMFRNTNTTTSIVVAIFALGALVLHYKLLLRSGESREAQRAYRVATDGAEDGCFTWKGLAPVNGLFSDYRLLDCNDRGAQLYGIPRETIINQTLRQILGKHEDYCNIIIQKFNQAFAKGYVNAEYQIPPESSLTVEWVHAKLVATRDGLAVTLRDVAETKALEQKMAQMATEDSLTGLPNRHWLTTNLPLCLAKAKARAEEVGVLFIDLDNFKNVNDSLGHSTGDELLQAAAKRLTSLVRPSDQVIRLGGDEFTVILSPFVTHETCGEVAARIVQGFKIPFELSESRNTLGVSIGVALFPRDGTDTETLLKSADIAMYSAKKNRGCYRYFESSMYALLQSRIALEADLAQSLCEPDQFKVCYQPRVDTKTGALVGAEALVRWHHPIRGIVSPADFIPVAEASDHILTLGALVMDRVCAQLAQWRVEGKPLVPISVNVSPRQFDEANVRELIADCLYRHRLPAELLEIELTESVMMHDEQKVTRELLALANMGIKVHIDDFGTGYSSLSLLQQVDADVLKIDRAFTSRLGTTGDSQVLFGAMVAMAHALGMAVVAEGVETEEQLQILQSLNCDELQGYLFSKPLSVEDMSALLLVPGHFTKGNNRFAALRSKEFSCKSKRLAS